MDRVGVGVFLSVLSIRSSALLAHVCLAGACSKGVFSLSQPSVQTLLVLQCFYSPCVQSVICLNSCVHFKSPKHWQVLFGQVRIQHTLCQPWRWNMALPSGRGIVVEYCDILSSSSPPPTPPQNQADVLPCKMKQIEKIQG